MKLQILHHVPSGLLTAAPEELVELLGGPTLIYLKGEQEPPLFLSCLLHGNEHSGLFVIQSLLAQYADGKPLGRSLWVFIGNVAAAADGLRMQHHQPDMNRVWAGGEGQMAELCQQVKETVTQQPLFACIDIHNNTGRNPIYSCITNISTSCKAVAAAFSPVLVYFTRPAGALSVEMSRFAEVSLTLECGLSGSEPGLSQSLELVQQLMAARDFSEFASGAAKPVIYESLLRVELQPGVSFGFKGEEAGDGSDVDLLIHPDIDGFNFQTPGSKVVLMELRRPMEELLRFVNVGEGEFTNTPFKIENQGFSVADEVVLSMFTKDRDVIVGDCLGYLMQVKEG